MSQTLPSFRKPPIVETAVSLQFRPIEGFTNAHLGLFWREVRNDFPKLHDAEPIPNQIELFGDQVSRRPRLPRFRVVAGEAAARLQMSSADDTAMVQLQNGRIVANWRRAIGAEYPRWQAVLPRFESTLKALRVMLAAHELKDIEPNQWEVTYVNHLERGRDWQTAHDWPFLVPTLIGQIHNLSGGLVESLNFRTHMALPDIPARLHVELHHGFKGAESDSMEILVLQLTARGGMEATDVDVTRNFLETGHRAIVHAFCDLTGETAQTRWEREQ